MYIIIYFYCYYYTSWCQEVTRGDDSNIELQQRQTNGGGVNVLKTVTVSITIHFGSSGRDKDKGDDATLNSRPDSVNHRPRIL